MKLTIEGNETEIKNVFQAIGSSKEHEILQNEIKFKADKTDVDLLKSKLTKL